MGADVVDGDDLARVVAEEDDLLRQHLHSHRVVPHVLGQCCTVFPHARRFVKPINGRTRPPNL